MLDAHRTTLEACRFCWMCRHACPAGLVTRRETTTPRGWALQLWLWTRGLLPSSRELAEELSYCLQCGLCEAWCVPGFAPHRAIRDARAQLAAQGLVPASVEAVRQNLRVHQNPFGPAHQPPLEAAAPWDVLYIPGCVEAALRPGLSTSLLALLRRAGLRAVPARSPCCGAIAHDLGLDGEAERLAEGLHPLLGEASLAVVWGHACRRFIQDRWPHLKHVRSPGQVLSDLVATRQLRWSRSVNLRVVLQEPCREAPEERVRARAFLEGIPGVRLLDPAPSDGRAPCCGGAGGMPLLHPELALELAAGRLRAIRSAGGEACVTTSPTCHAVLHQARHAVPNVEVLDIVEVVLRALT